MNSYLWCFYTEIGNTQHPLDYKNDPIGIRFAMMLKSMEVFLLRI